MIAFATFIFFIIKMFLEKKVCAITDNVGA